MDQEKGRFILLWNNVLHLADLPAKQQENCRNHVCSGNRILGRSVKRKGGLSLMPLQQAPSSGVKGLPAATQSRQLLLPPGPHLKQLLKSVFAIQHLWTDPLHERQWEIHLDSPTWYGFKGPKRKNLHLQFIFLSAGLFQGLNFHPLMVCGFKRNLCFLSKIQLKIAVPRKET